MSDGMIELYEKSYTDFKAAKIRINELESEIQEFCKTFENAGDYHEQISVSLAYYRKFKQLLKK